MDLSDIPDLIKNETNYKYILHILDHYSKYLFDELLTNKKAETIISKLPNIFYINGFPEEICLDNGKEFRNKKLSKFLKDKNFMNYMVYLETLIHKVHVKEYIKQLQRI